MKRSEKNTVSILLDLLRQYEPTRRNRLAELAGVSAPTVTNLVHDLIDQGIVRETGVTSSAGHGPGRPSQLLELVPNSRLVLGVHLGYTRPAMALVNLRGQIISAESLPNELVMEPSLEKMMEIGKLAKDFAARQRVSQNRLIGIGIGVPNIPPWDHQGLADAFRRLHVPVAIDHNVRAMTLGEFVFGNKQQPSSMVFVNLGYGIGAGIIIHGEIWMGATGRAGELGHVRVTDESVLCRCGNVGCLESVAGERALVAKARSLLPEMQGKDHEQVVDLIVQYAQGNNPQVLDLLRQAGGYLGLALADLVNLVNPQAVVLGGRLSSVGDILSKPIREAVYARSQSGSAEVVDFRPSLLGTQVGLIGSATLILMKQFYAMRQPTQAHPAQGALS
jgi:predicted NBD/HSP70 family sugar kinase